MLAAGQTARCHSGSGSGSVGGSVRSGCGDVHASGPDVASNRLASLLEQQRALKALVSETGLRFQCDRSAG